MGYKSFEEFAKEQNGELRAYLSLQRQYSL